MFFNKDILNEAIKRSNDEKYLIYKFDSNKWDTEESFDKSVSAMIDFPDCYESNHGAFNDCVSDLYNPRIIFQPVGAVPVPWNYLEWIDKNRVLLYDHCLATFAQHRI
ncbi:hypothetical protein IPJ91_00075 [bacterium]|nr:MAG: hypothetical protein IPJ91_00075 [bacterium]